MISLTRAPRHFGSYIVKPFDLDPLELKLGAIPQKYLLSSYLKPVDTANMPSLGIEVQNSRPPRVSKRTPEYSLTRAQYLQFANKHPHGKVQIFRYQDVNFTLAGSHWSQVPNKNLHKLLIYTRPDAILLQVRPDQILQKFNCVFESSKKYMEQITREGEEIMPTQLAESIGAELGFEKVEFQEFAPYKLRERVPLEKVAVLSYYAKLHSIPIILMDMPEKIFRETLANQLTLVQLQEFLKMTARLAPQHPDLKPKTPLNIAYQCFPEVFLKRSDEFMSTIIEYLAAKKTYKRVFGLVGNMSSDAIADLVDNRSASHLSAELEIPKIKRSYIKDLTCEDMVERHAILDVMYYGQAFAHLKRRKYFPSTTSVIAKYADPNSIDKNRFEQMKYLHLEMLKKYQNFANQQYLLGEEDLKVEYMRKANLI